jgi:hypothetical protein
MSFSIFHSQPFPGIQYFPDTEHYSAADASLWIPILEQLRFKSLVLTAEPSRAIPEHFICSLVNSGIQPIVRYHLSLSNPPAPSEMNPIFSAYGKWGVGFISFFDQPNQLKSWDAESWTRQDLVERFVDRFLSFAKPALSANIRPLFSPLFPGGSYWDTLFLEQSLASLKRRREFNLLDQLTVAAYGWTFNHPLNWGQGGPSQWPATRPYQISPENQDQRGFCITDWYIAISNSILGSALPVMLFECGLPGDSARETDQMIQSRFDSYKSIFGMIENKPDNSQNSELSVSKPQSINLSLLVCNPTHPSLENAWFFTDASPTPLGEKMIELLTKPETLPSSSHNIDAPHTQIENFLLLPSFEWGVADWHLDIVKSYIKRKRPTVGFSLKEAAFARNVIVIGDHNSFPDEALTQLRQNGCVVDRITGDGTSIATQLAER